MGRVCVSLSLCLCVSEQGRGAMCEPSPTLSIVYISTHTDADNPPGKAQAGWLYHDDKC